MYKKAVKISDSDIEGRGVFAEEAIRNGEAVWVFEPGYDQTITMEEFKRLSNEVKEELEKIGYLSPWTGLRVFPPENDPARYTNHSSDNNLTAIYDKNISEEPIFVANRDIKEGEELTNNYHEFDLLTQKIKPDWAN